MLLDFSVGNFRSFKEIATFSMGASSAAEHSDTHIIKKINYPKSLRSAAIYGANASGKSNFMRAVSFMRSFVINSAKETQIFEKIGVESHRLSIETTGKSSFFQVNFICGNTLYRYGFEVDAEAVREEWLFSKTLKSRGPDSTLFTREGQKVVLGAKFKEGEGIETKVRPNALFLSTVAQFNGEISGEVLRWFSNCNIIGGTEDRDYLDYTAQEYLNDTNFKETFLKLLKVADLGIDDVRVEERKFAADNLPDEFPQELAKELLGKKFFGVKTSHKIYDKNGATQGTVYFDLLGNESAGTQKMFSFGGPVIDTLREGKVLFIDEFDAKLHPTLAEAIIEIFNSPEANPKGAQLIFATHTTHFLNKNMLRRDQIWFANKSRQGATSLYSLIEHRDDANLKIRPDASFEKNYYEGRYRATPNVGNLAAIFEEDK